MAATVLGSGLVSLDATVVTLAVPRIGADLGTGMAGLQWVLSGYLLSLASLILVGGALGDRFGRRAVFVAGTVLFAAASLGCGLADSVIALVGARVLQGVGGALVTPASLALIAAAVDPRDRGAAIGMWAGLGGIAGVAGPVVGGWLVEAGGWRTAFLVNIPLAAIVVAISLRHVPESCDPPARPRVNAMGALLLVLPLGISTYGLIATRWWWAGFGAVLLCAVLSAQGRGRNPLIPSSLFTSRAFTVVNLVTLPVYAALGCVLFLLALCLQIVVGYSPAGAGAGAATVPVTAVLLVGSTRAGRYAQRRGARGPMAVGLAVTAAGALLLAEIGPDAGYLVDVLPGLLLLGLGQAIFVAPLTGAVFDAVPAAHAGTASGINNAIARTGHLLAVAAVPGMAGITDTPLTDSGAFGTGYRIAVWICSGFFLAGAALSAALMPRPETCSRKRSATEAVTATTTDGDIHTRESAEIPDRPDETAEHCGPEPAGDFG